MRPTIRKWFIKKFTFSKGQIKIPVADYLPFQRQTWDLWKDLKKICHKQRLKILNPRPFQIYLPSSANNRMEQNDQLFPYQESFLLNRLFRGDIAIDRLRIPDATGSWYWWRHRCGEAVDWRGRRRSSCNDRIPKNLQILLERIVRSIRCHCCGVNGWTILLTKSKFWKENYTHPIL